DRARDRTGVERIASILRDRIKRRGETRIGEDLAERGWRAVREEGRRRRRIGRKDRDLISPLVRDQLGDGKAVTREGDRRRQRGAEIDRAESRQQLMPAFD